MTQIPNLLDLVFSLSAIPMPDFYMVYCMGGLSMFLFI